MSLLINLLSRSNPLLFFPKALSNLKLLILGTRVRRAITGDSAGILGSGGHVGRHFAPLGAHVDSFNSSYASFFDDVCLRHQNEASSTSG